MEIEFVEEDIIVDRTLNALVQFMGGKESAHVIGSCLVNGNYEEFGVVFQPGQPPIASGGHAPVNAHNARSIKVTSLDSDEELVAMAKQAVTELYSRRKP